MKKLKQWNNPLMKLKNTTKICKICLKPIKNIGIFEFLNPDYCVCKNCRKEKLIPVFKKFYIDDVSCLSLYYYDDNIKALIYQLKGCYDIELAPIFLERYNHILTIIYHSYYKVHIPSYKKDDEAREFNHVKEIFKNLNLRELDLLEKVEHHKQSSTSQKERVNIKHYLRLKSNNSLKGKNILIVDDISTTGSTLKSAIELIKQLNPRNIKVLVIAKSNFINF